MKRMYSESIISTEMLKIIKFGKSAAVTLCNFEIKDNSLPLGNEKLIS